ncbi:hypothetical protein LPB68_03035 [Paenibacillus crassostreae]|nr:hypothetical protein LPB68_03035 [Paenibacillus crassostreae]
MQSKSSHSISSKKVVSAMLASIVALSSGSIVFGDESTPVVSSTVAASSGSFSDVKSNYAEKHIYKLAAQGILLGDKGLFRPNDYVTQQEAVTMAIRFMNIQDQINTNSDVVLPANFTANSYFKPFVALALKQNLLDKTVETDDTTTKTTWGEKRASREWITELLVKAIGKDSEAVALANNATTFVDNSKISSSKLGYVNAAITMGITNGIEGNRFDPQGSVTRAQLATFFSRGGAFSDVQYANAAEGIVTGLTDNSISLYVNGSVRNFTLENTTAFYTKTLDTKISLSDLKLYSKVMIVGDNGKASYVEVTDPTEQLESIETTFERLFPGNSLGVSTNTSFESFVYNSNTVFLDENGLVIKPEAITAGSQIIIKRENFTENKNLIVVQVKTGVVNKTASGTLESVDPTNKLIGIKNIAGTIETYSWDDFSRFSYQNEILIPSELSLGSVITYEIGNNILRSIVVTEAVERKVRGTLYEIGSSGTTLTYTKETGGLEVQMLSEKPEIVISGIDEPLLADLLADRTSGDKVELTLDSKEVVTKVVVLSRQMEQKPGSAVVSYDKKTKLLTLQDAKGNPLVVTLDSTTKLTYNTTTPTLTGMEALLTNGRVVNLTYISNRALSLDVVYKYDGTLTALDTIARKVTIKVAGGQSITLPYGTISIEKYGKGYLNMLDLSIGNEVSLVLSDDQAIVQRILVKSVAQYVVDTVNSTSNFITVKSGIGSTTIYLNYANVINDTGQAIKASDLKAGQVINVHFMGNTAKTAQLIKLITGEVVSVDTANGNITVKNYSGGTEVYKVEGALKLLRTGSVSTVLNGLLVGDRVEIRKDVDGTTNINVLSSLNHTYWKYTSSPNELFVKRKYSDEKYRFVLSPTAYIHQGDTTLPVQSLKENDNIVLYFNNDVIVEIQKQ